MEQMATTETESATCSDCVSTCVVCGKTFTKTYQDHGCTQRYETKTCSTECFRRLRRKVTLALWKTPEYRNSMLADNRGLFRKGNVPWHKGRHGIFSEETRVLFGRPHKGVAPWNKGMHGVLSKETRRAISEGVRRLWQDPAYRTEQLENLALGRMKIKINDTSLEKQFQAFLDWLKISYEKHKFIGMKEIDIFLKPNLCVFLDGEYWHRNTDDYDMKVSKDLISQGYYVIRIGEEAIMKLSNEELLQRLPKKIMMCLARARNKDDFDDVFSPLERQEVE